MFGATSRRVVRLSVVEIGVVRRSTVKLQCCFLRGNLSGGKYVSATFCGDGCWASTIDRNVAQLTGGSQGEAARRAIPFRLLPRCSRTMVTGSGACRRLVIPPCRVIVTALGLRVPTRESFQPSFIAWSGRDKTPPWAAAVGLYSTPCRPAARKEKETSTHFCLAD